MEPAGPGFQEKDKFYPHFEKKTKYFLCGISRNPLEKQEIYVIIARQFFSAGENGVPCGKRLLPTDNFLNPKEHQLSWNNIDEHSDENNGSKERYDNFKAMLKNVSLYTQQYRSFVTGKTYTNLLGKTATGLLKDIVAKTETLSEQEKKQHKYSLEVFSAFCTYFCIKKITSGFQNTDLTLGQDVVTNVYLKVLKHIKRDMETDGKSLFVRNLIERSAKNSMFDQMEKNGRTIGIDDGSSDNTDDDLKDVPGTVRIELVDGTLDTIRNEEKRKSLNVALAQAYKNGILTKKELYAICHYYGFGEGFKKLSNHEIAVKFGCSDPHASRLRAEGLRKLQSYILDTPKLRQEFP